MSKVKIFKLTTQDNILSYSISDVIRPLIKKYDLVEHIHEFLVNL